MAQQLTKKENVQKIPAQVAPAIDWDLHLYSLWLQKMALNPLYHDVKVSHYTGSCSCHYNPNLYLMEVRKRK